jgi:hypothetical protein
MNQTTIIGIDCATQDTRVGLALASAGPEGCIVRFAGGCSGERALAQEVAQLLTDSPRALLAFDAPLGWPRPMGEALSGHRAGLPLAVPAHDLFRRATDRFVRAQIGKQSLDVGADRIARTAHSALGLLANVRRETALSIPLAWNAAFSDRAAAIEVYPAATLIAHGIPTAGYKQKEDLAARQAIIRQIAKEVKLPADNSKMVQSGDALDAAICVLAAYDFLRGEAYDPKELELAQHEGWIWVRRLRDASA